jgi:hypothetical protein
MHAEKLLHRIIGKSCQIDKRILRTLFEATETLTRCKKLSIVGIARGLTRPAKVKHLIKCIDRLFSNKRLHNDKLQLYRAMVNLIVGNITRPIVVVDWSGLTSCGTYHFLRAALAVKGRTITLYEQSYHISEYTSYKTHKHFLLTLKKLLPKGCRPIIVTDAGFRNTWFSLVQSFGLDFIGRIRNNTQYRDNSDSEWEPIKKLYIFATLRAKFLGSFLLAKNNPLFCYLYLMRQRKKSREKRNLVGKKAQCSVSLKHARGGNEPWLIASSLGPEIISAQKIMLIYKKRMQIEETFRDLKNSKNGFCLKQCRSHGEKRWDIALLIGTLAMFALWLIGIAAKQKQIHYSFQSNTIRNRDVLSVISVGWQALEQRIRFTCSEIQSALQEIILCAAS